jgi:signal transduction histidine kinase
MISGSRLTAMHDVVPRLRATAEQAGTPVAPGERRAGIGVAVGSVAAALVAVSITSRTGTWGVPSLADQLTDLTVAVSCSVMGPAVLAGRRPSRRLGWLFVAVGAAAGLTTLATAGAAAATSATSWAQALASISTLAWVFGFLPLLTLLPLLYPDGRALGPRWRLAGVAAVVGMVLLAVAAALHPDRFQGRVEIPKAVSAGSVADLLGPVVAVVLVPAVLASFVSLFVRLRRSGGLERRQVVVLLGAVALLVTEVAVHALLPGGVQPFSQAVAVLMLPVATGVAVTRHRLFELDLAILRGLVALSVAGCLTGAFLTVFAIIRAVTEDGSTVATAVAAACAALLLQPLGSRLSRGAERLLYGDRADPFAVVSRFATLLRDGVPLDELPERVCETVVSSLRLGSARLEMGGTVAEVGEAVGAAYAVELVHRGEPLGTLRVTPRPGEQVVDARDRDLLAAIADQIAPAVSAVRSYAELRRSREALVAAREEERRRLRRELHDGVGAALAGARLQLESARALVEDPVAGRLLDAAGAGVAAAVDDVRHVTEDLRPPALDELGLAVSLRGLAERMSSPAHPVQAAVVELPPLPAAVEVACFRIASEALTNAIRHSGGTHTRLTVQIAGPRLVLEVVDDGTGITAGARTDGVGLVSMRQRAEEVGGRVELLADHGTTVRVELPKDVA